jgi:hypothetical protein
MQKGLKGFINIYFKSNKHMNKFIAIFNNVFGVNVKPSTFKCIDKIIFVYQLNSVKKQRLYNILIKIFIIYILKKLNLNMLFP